ncbi:Thaumatin-like protein 1 [Camellia lanceoleosa]|uniref:Thaumatin-like protein 1 n=1 Tax=Camellia lanceoleosa TaxID=1840588 RepID=A0ACC0H897_9ERIC|nr:Thaumatin-like protein 1 [Camellia lanceoleosa]
MFTVTSPWMFLMFFLVKSFPTNSFASTFTVTNNCPQTIWPGTLAGSGTLQLSTTGFKLDSGQSVKIPAFPGWSGRIWARTGCKFDESGVGTCQTGDCGGRLECDGVGAAPPASLFEITMGTNADEKDFYDVSIVDGYNLPLIAAPQEVFGVCNATGCVSDLNTGCPKELQVVDGDNGGVGVVGCKSACEAFGLDQYCCSGEFANPTTCRPSSYSTIFKTACPRAYSYAFDDGTSTFTCKASDYAIIFCPNLASGKKRSSSAIPIPAPPMVQFQHTINREISDMVSSSNILWPIPSMSIIIIILLSLNLYYSLKE